MNLDRLAIEIRPRRPWEATDLGLLMARRWWKPLTTLWFCASFPVFVLLCFLPAEWLWTQVIVIWWLKPLLERPLLNLLSQSVFGEAPTTKGAFKTFFRLARKQWFLSLFWRRFSPNRSVDSSVVLLEGLSGERRKKRLAVLHREGTSPSFWLTIIGVHIETAIALSFIALLWSFIPQNIELQWEDAVVLSEQYLTIIIFNLFSYIGMLLVAPFYVAMGFSLYLSRRIALEGWDIEIAFKRMLQKHEQRESRKFASRSPLNPSAENLNNEGAEGEAELKTANKTADKNRSEKMLPSVLLLCGLLLTASFASDKVSASESVLLPEVENSLASSPSAENIATVRDPQSAKEAIDQIKAGEVFNHKETTSYLDFSWTLDEEDKDEEDKAFEWPEYLNFLKPLFKVIGAFFGVLDLVSEVALWCIVILVTLFIVYRYRDWLRKFANLEVGGDKSRYVGQPETLFGMAVTSDSLPESVSDEALALWQAERGREAIALLYRACLVRLIESGVALRGGDTERACVNKALRAFAQNQIDDSAKTYFAELTRIWQRMAYGHIQPDSVTAEKVCSDWNSIWLSSEVHSRQAANKGGDR